MTQTAESELINQESIKNASDLAVYASKLIVKSHDDYTCAGVDLKRVKDTMRALETQRKELTAPLDESKKRIMDMFRQPLSALESAEIRLKSSMSKFLQEQERIRLEAERKAREQAEREAEKERQRLLAQAQKAEDKGKEEKAEALKEQAQQVYVPPVVVAMPKAEAKGVTMREVWKFEITDEMKIPREYLIVDESKIRKVVSALKGQTSISGVRVYSEKVLAA